MRTIAHWSVSLVLVLGLVLSACAAPKAPPAPATPSAPATLPATPATAPARSEWDKVLEAARKEGSLVLYTTWAAQLGESARAAMKEYGIALETVGGRGGDLELKIRTEQRANANVADLLLTGWTNAISIADAGLVQPPAVALPVLAEKDVWKVHPRQHGPDGVFVLGRGVNLTTVINTDLVKKGEITSWNDLLDPKWKDKMVMTDPRPGSGPGSSGMGTWTTLGEDYWKKMAAQRITIHVSYDLVIDEVVQGVRAVAIFPAFGTRLVDAIRAGAPVQIVHLKEGTPDFLYGISLVKGAPHPNASMVFLNWLLSKQGQAIAGKALENYVIRKDVTEEWFKVAELRPGAFNWLEPSPSLDLAIPKKGADFAKKIFGER